MLEICVLLAQRNCEGCMTQMIAGRGWSLITACRVLTFSVGGAVPGRASASQHMGCKMRRLLEVLMSSFYSHPATCNVLSGIYTEPSPVVSFIFQMSLGLFCFGARLSVRHRQLRSLGVARVHLSASSLSHLLGMQRYPVWTIRLPHKNG